MLIKIYVETPDNIERAGYYKEVHAEVSTSALLAELEKRRPCDRCVNPKHMARCMELSDECRNCIWEELNDNFKPAK